MTKININKTYLAKTYVRYKLANQGIITIEIEKSLGFDLLTNSMQKISITKAVMTNHKTTKNSNDYNYNIWEFKVPEVISDYLICVCFEMFDKKLKKNGYFIFPKELIKTISKSGSITIFESDISGNYSREPKINKYDYFKNYKQLEIITNN